MYIDSLHKKFWGAIVVMIVW